jgi:hypothetical protein
VPLLTEKAHRLRTHRQNHGRLPIAVFFGKMACQTTFMFFTGEPTEIKKLGKELKRLPRALAQVLFGGLTGYDVCRDGSVVGVKRQYAAGCFLRPRDLRRRGNPDPKYTTRAGEVQRPRDKVRSKCLSRSAQGRI